MIWKGLQDFLPTLERGGQPCRQSQAPVFSQPHPACGCVIGPWPTPVCSHGVHEGPEDEQLLLSFPGEMGWRWRLTMLAYELENAARQTFQKKI
jgi:hypothetical protein